MKSEPKRSFLKYIARRNATLEKSIAASTLRSRSGELRDLSTRSRRLALFRGRLLAGFPVVLLPLLPRNCMHTGKAEEGWVEYGETSIKIEFAVIRFAMDSKELHSTFTASLAIGDAEDILDGK